MSANVQFRILEVGGFVRDDLLGIPSKDRDCTVVIEGDTDRMSVERGFALMRAHLQAEGFSIFVETPEHGTIRARPSDGTLPADFVLARREGPYSDGRRPDWVELGTLEDDLDRRDFTVNAMARDVETGEIIDRHNGMADIESKVLRFVGDPMQRITEDALRVMRALRFTVTKGFTLDAAAKAALADPTVPDLLAQISDERRAGELHTMFMFADTVRVLDLISHEITPDLLEAMFSGTVRLTSTMKKSAA
jgi:tRNA nucleotidyltransferase/poly(A) polymerase